MSRNQLSGLALVALLAAAPATIAAPTPVLPSVIPLGEEGDAPAGFLAMCRETPEYCPAPPPPVASRAPRAVLMPIGLSLPIPLLPLSQDRPVLPAIDLAELRRVNKLVNHRVRQVTDARAFGVEDLWRPSGIGRGAVGDCEDLALEKQRQLTALGYAPSATRLAVVYSRSIGLHVVLVARSAQGDVVLDNRSGKVLPWHKSRYRWLRIQSSVDPTRWNQIGTTGQADGTITA